MFRVALSFVILFTFSACSTPEKARKSEQSKVDATETPSYLVGTIAMVNPEQRFVLIKAQPGMALPPGHSLTAMDANGTVSELVISAERKASHVTADIKSGNPKVGNLVAYMPKPQNNPSPSKSASADAPSPDGSTSLPNLTPLVPVTGTGAPYSGPPKVEWREGQPPPFQSAGGSPNLDAAPLVPLPETDLTPIPTLPPVIE